MRNTQIGCNYFGCSLIPHFPHLIPKKCLTVLFLPPPLAHNPVGLVWTNFRFYLCESYCLSVVRGDEVAWLYRKKWFLVSGTRENSIKTKHSDMKTFHWILVLFTNNRLSCLRPFLVLWEWGCKGMTSSVPAVTAPVQSARTTGQALREVLGTFSILHPIRTCEQIAFPSAKA